jgi:hypothetical protein
MPFSVTITIIPDTGTPGPYNLYSNTDSYTTAFATSVSATGNVITSSSVPDGTTNIKIKSTGASCNYEIIKSISGLPTLPPTTPPTLPPTLPPTTPPTSPPTATPTVTGPTPTPTPVVTTLSNVTSGNTLNQACAGGGNITLYFSGASIQIGESLYTNSSLTNPVPAGYYYYPDYNTIYNVINGSTGVVVSTPACPTATPLSTFLGYDSSTGTLTGPLAVSLVDDDLGSTVCTNPEYVFGDGTGGTVPWNFTVYGTTIMNATAIVLLSSGFRSELTLNAYFYVRQRISGVFYWRKFQLNGSPGDTAVTASPVGSVSGTC